MRVDVLANDRAVEFAENNLTYVTEADLAGVEVLQVFVKPVLRQLE